MKTIWESFQPHETLTILALKTRQTKTIQATLQRQSEELSILENKLQQEITRYIHKLGIKVVTTYNKAAEQKIPIHNIQTLIYILLQSWHEEYTPLLLKYQLLTQKLSEKHTQELITLQKKKRLGINQSKETLTIQPILTLQDNPIQYLATKAQTTLDHILPPPEQETHYTIEENKNVTQKLESMNLKLSEKTKQRITGDINNILTHSETEGIGPRQVAQQIRERFDKLETYEAERIARTEIRKADNQYRYETLINDNMIDYLQWRSNIDHKTRGQKKHDKANHVKMHGEIIRKGEQFSNGLRYPGDPQGRPEEIINCRCTLLPYILPFDKIAPVNQTQFKETDLQDMPNDPQQQFLLETIENTRIIAPTDGGFQIFPHHMKINKVNQTLHKLQQQTLNGYIKNKTQLQTTLDKYLTKEKPTTQSQIKKTIQKTLDNLNEYIPQLKKPHIKDLRMHNHNPTTTLLPDEIINEKTLSPKRKQKLQERIIKHENKINELKKEQKYYAKLKDTSWDEYQSLKWRNWPQDKKIDELNQKIKALKENTVDINKIKPEYREEYKKLLNIKETRSLINPESAKLRTILKRSDEYHEPDPKLIKKLEDELEQLKTQKEILIETERKKLIKIKRRCEKKLEHHKCMIKWYEKRIGRAHIKLKTKPSDVIKNPPRIEFAEGEPFTKWDHIEGADREVVTEEYEQFGKVYNAQESNVTIGIEHYTKGSGHFNQYVRQKLDNDTEGMKDTLINALVNTSSKQNKYTDNVKDFINLPTLDANGKAKPKELQEAIKSFKKLLNKKDKRAIKALNEMKEIFERDYREFMYTSLELAENVVTHSGQNLDKIGKLKVGDKYISQTFISTALSEDATDYFVGRVIKDGKKACKLTFYNRKKAKYVVIGPRSQGNILETELAQLPETEGEVFDITEEVVDTVIDGVHIREVVPNYHILI